MSGMLLMRVALLALAAPGEGPSPVLRQEQDHVIWSQDIPDAADAETLVIEGTEDAGAFRPVTVRLPATEAIAHRPLAPLDANLLEHLDLRVFGTKERAHAHRDGAGIALECAAGTQAAGIVLSASKVRLPRRMEARLVLAGNASGNWGISVVQRGDDAPDRAQLDWLGGTARLPISFISGDEEVVVTCPAEQAHAQIESLAVAPASAPGQTTLGTWQWHQADWAGDPAEFAARLQRAALHEVALQMQIADDTIVAPRALRRLLDELAELGIAARFVEGDPAMATTAGLPEALRRARALRDAARAMGRDLGPLELDIEPYALPGYGLKPAAAWTRWADAVLALAEAWGGRVVVDVPWWMFEAPGGEQALERVRHVLDAAVVMAYRTDVARLVEASEPWLSWGTHRNLPIKIAIEAGPVADEVQRTYRRAAEGELHLFAADGRVTLQPRPMAPPAGAVAYRFMRESRAAASRVSFCGQDRRRQEVQDASIPILAAWPAFAGFRIHGLLASPQQPGCG